MSHEPWTVAGSDVSTLVRAAFDEVKDFRIAFVASGSLGEHLQYRDGDRVIATFPWWDNVSVMLKKSADDFRACGTPDAPYHDLEQGWSYLAFEENGFAYVLEGNGEDRYATHFRVPSQRFLAEWRRAVSDAKARHDACDSFEEALAHPDEVRALSVLRVEEIPDAIRTLRKLERFRCSLSPVRTLPDGFLALGALRFLDLPMTELERLPEGLGALTALEVLNVMDTPLTALPSSLGKLRALREIMANAAPLTSLPDALCSLPALASLSFHSCKLEALPEGLGGLAALRDLTISQNALSALPESLGRLVGLRQLYADGNQLTRVPSLAALHALEVLELGNNQLTEVPDSVRALPRLERLHLSGNRINELPEWLETHPALRIFEAADNPLSPSSAARLERIQTKLGPPKYF